MNINKWHIFNKSGSNINWSPTSFINLTFSGGIGASGYAITDFNKHITSAEMNTIGYGYSESSQVTTDYTFGNSTTYSITDVSVIIQDISIFNPNPTSSKGISGIISATTDDYIYPSVLYSSALFLNPISVGLVETELLTILESSLGSYIRPYDSVNSTLTFRMIGDETQISLFFINDNEQTIDWCDELVFDTSIISTTPLYVNIGFKADVEGVFERRLKIIHTVNSTEYIIGEILINAQSIGEDERLNTLIENFGLYKPKNNPQLFKETNINEDLPDWELLNYKAKHLILEYNKIIPYIGTYKALINSLKWLGYDDIYVKEWFLNVKDNKKISKEVSFDARDRSQTLLALTPDQRRHLKKLNELSLIYCITRESGTVDDWGVPKTENCYAYNLNEVLIKLYSLKKWLEENIIGVNARITDLTGEGIYIERYKNIIYSTENYGFDDRYEQSLTPTTVDDMSELVSGDSSIGLTLKELSIRKIGDFNFTFKELIEYGWDSSNGMVIPGDTSIDVYDPSYYGILTGPSFAYPLPNLREVIWKATVDKKDSGVLTTEFVTEPLHIVNNEIKFSNANVEESYFDTSMNLRINLVSGWLRDASNDDWLDSSVYSFRQDICTGIVTLETSTGISWFFKGFIEFKPDTGAVLQYKIDDNYLVPILSFKNFKFTDTSGDIYNLETDKLYHLDILKGDITIDSSDKTSTWSLIFNDDTSLNEEEIYLEVIYQTDRITLYQYDPSVYYNLGANDPSVILIDNSVYHLSVNHTGDYEIEVFGFDGNNNIFTNNINDPYNVWNKHPYIYHYTTIKNKNVVPLNIDSLTDISTLIKANPTPIFDMYAPLQGITLEYDSSLNPYINVPSISYFINLPAVGSIEKFINLTERCTSINQFSITIDPDFQSFNTDASYINLVLFDKTSYNLIDETSTYIINSSSYTYDISPGIPLEWLNQEVSTYVYALNATEIEITTITQEDSSHISIYVPQYPYRINQLVSVIIKDVSWGYSWGSSFRITDEIDTSTYLLDGTIPEFYIDNTNYKKYVKHAFSLYSDLEPTVQSAEEINGGFNIYLNDPYLHQYYLDSTFKVINIDFDQAYVNTQWYDDASDGTIINTDSSWYGYITPITVAEGTLIILRSHYEESNYMLEQKNMWKIYKRNSQNIPILIARVYNDIVPFVYDSSGIYDIWVDSWDKYGNLKTSKYEGLISII